MIVHDKTADGDIQHWEDISYLIRHITNDTTNKNAACNLK